MSYSMADVREWIKNNPELLENPEISQLLGEGPKVLKYRNKPTRELDGELYDSGKEAEDARKFVYGVMAGEYILYKHHVTVKLPSGSRLELDHLLVDNQFKVRVFDTKPFDVKSQKFRCTPEWKVKAREFEQHYGIKIELI